MVQQVDKIQRSSVEHYALHDAAPSTANTLSAPTCQHATPGCSGGRATTAALCWQDRSSGYLPFCQFCLPWTIQVHTCSPTISTFATVTRCMLRYTFTPACLPLRDGQIPPRRAILPTGLTFITGILPPFTVHPTGGGRTAVPGLGCIQPVDCRFFPTTAPPPPHTHHHHHPTYPTHHLEPWTCGTVWDWTLPAAGSAAAFTHVTVTGARAPASPRRAARSTLRAPTPTHPCRRHFAPGTHGTPTVVNMLVLHCSCFC